MAPMHCQGTYSALVYRQPHPQVCGYMSWLAREARQPAHIPLFSRKMVHASKCPPLSKDGEMCSSLRQTKTQSHNI